MKIKIISRSA
jgi:hypothetical protein